jgi:hypothetical protein
MGEWRYSSTILDLGMNKYDADGGIILKLTIKEDSRDKCRAFNDEHDEPP